MKHQEHIVAVPASIFNERVNGYSDVEIAGEDIIIAQRRILETDDNYRQLIPINVLVCDGKVWVYRRTTSGGEERLHGLASVSVGGHWDLDDIVTKSSVIDLTASLTRAAQREVAEEINIQSTGHNVSLLKEKIVSDRTAVDRVHCAIILVHHLTDPTVTAKEEHLEAIGWASPEELLKQTDFELETWTTKVCEILKAAWEQKEND